MMRLAILISGRGSNMEALVRRNQQEGFFDLCFIASSRASAEGLQRARQLGLLTKILPYHESSEAAESELEKLWQVHKLDALVLAGFMRVLSPEFTKRHERRILNIHPSLLPDFPGAHAIDDFWLSGQSISGVTVHIVDEQMDHGPILRQAPLRRHHNETKEAFEARLHELEHQLYWETLKQFGISFDTQAPLHERSTSQ